MNKEQPVAAIMNTVLHHYPVAQAIHLFGSYQTEEEWPDSDVDIAILLPHDAAKGAELMAISECKNKLQAALGREIDLVNVRLTSTFFNSRSSPQADRSMSATRESLRNLRCSPSPSTGS
jgi:uncharacterized protein